MPLANCQSFQYFIICVFIIVKYLQEFLSCEVFFFQCHFLWDSFILFLITSPLIYVDACTFTASLWWHIYSLKWGQCHSHCQLLLWWFHWCLILISLLVLSLVSLLHFHLCWPVLSINVPILLNVTWPYHMGENKRRQHIYLLSAVCAWAE